MKFWIFEYFCCKKPTFLKRKHGMFQNMQSLYRASCSLQVVLFRCFSWGRFSLLPFLYLFPLPLSLSFSLPFCNKISISSQYFSVSLFSSVLRFLFFIIVSFASHLSHLSTLRSYKLWLKINIFVWYLCRKYINKNIAQSSAHRPTTPAMNRIILKLRLSCLL